MKDFHCRDAGINCDWVARGQTDEDVMRQAGMHAQQAHGMKGATRYHRISGS